jgi:hypothetical protein
VLHTVGVLGESTIEAIRDYHVRVRGWRDVGYHWLVGRDGVVYPGRREDQAGAHTAGANDTVGVCFSGDGDRQPWTYTQWVCGLSHLVAVCQRYGFSADAVCGHREAPARLRAMPTSKTCPGRLVDLDEVRAVLAAALAEARR